MPFRPITDLILVSPLIELREVLAFGSARFLTDSARFLTKVISPDLDLP